MMIRNLLRQKVFQELLVICWDGVVQEFEHIIDGVEYKEDEGGVGVERGEDVDDGGQVRNVILPILAHL